MSNRITIYQGDSFEPINDTVKDTAGNLVTDTLTGVLKIYSNNSRTAILTKTMTSMANSIAVYNITKIETAEFPVGLLNYETEYTYSDGRKFTGLRDYIEVKIN